MERKTGLRVPEFCRSREPASGHILQGVGRPRKLNTDQAQVATQLLAEGKPVRDIARTFNVHEATIYRLAAF
jgi:transposase